MMHDLYPWWMAYVIDQPLRKLLHPPEKILGPYVHEGMAVMDFGCGLGIFSIAMARMVGEKGWVLSVDKEQRTLDVLQKRAEKAGVAKRIQPERSESEPPGTQVAVDRVFDFILAFWVIHEVPDIMQTLKELRLRLKPGSPLLIAEPLLHVSSRDFQETLRRGQEAGLRPLSWPAIRWSRAVVLTAAD
jgi:2-polyprenyl-3-methyl-5-hydroxy-6-metoxy-1,4-benzoquinol methylase